MKKLLLNVVLVFLFVALDHMQTFAQGVYTMCVTATSTADSTGTLYDSGGPNNVYQISEDCTLLVAPSCATTITLTFQYFQTESGWDYFHVYDGQTTADPELLNTSGNVLPGPITCTSGYMLLIWHADPSIVDSGFIASWTSVIAPSVAPNAAFTMSTNNPPLNVDVQFTNTSVGGTTSWFWDFGDGDTSHRENPLHAYASPGPYTVKFVPAQCSEKDSITHTVTVQGSPNIDVTPLTGFSANVQCGDSANFTMHVGNTGGGDLVFNTDGTIVGAIKVLAMTYGTDQFVEFPRTIAAINSHFTNYTLTTTSTTVPGVLSGQLVGQNVLLIPEQETNSSNNVWPNLAPVIQSYLNNGGSVIFLGSNSSLADNIFSSGIFHGSFIQDEDGFAVTVLNNTHPITQGVVNFNAPQSTYSMNFTDTDAVVLAEASGNTVAAYRFYGSGKAIFLAFDFFSTNNDASLLLANAVQWGGENALPQWIHLSVTGDTVAPAGTVPVGVTFVANSLPAGTYYANIGVSSNDPNEPIVIVPCTLHVSGDPIINLSDNCFAFGQVIQYTTHKDTLRIDNVGCDTLFLDSLHTTGFNSPFTYNTSQGYILPGAFYDLVITFHDTSVQNVLDTLYIDNNDSDMVVCLSANSVPAPKAQTSQSSLVGSVRACGDTGSVSFDLINGGVAGAGDLIFTLGSLPSWVTASPTSGTIVQGQSLGITLHFASGTLVGGPYSTNLSIGSNDPQTPNKLVPITLNVDSNPCIDFTHTGNTCTGFTTFTSSSINTPTSYYWDFGDGDTSSAANPSHPYAHNGTYTTTLIACNSRGCDTAVQSVQAIITGPRATSCYPLTLNYCCGIGVTTFQIFDSLGYKINKASTDAVAGYQDFTCTDTATLFVNVPYNVNITTGFTYVERVKAWLDMNNDAYFDTLTELIYDSTNLQFHGGTFTIPDYPTNICNEPLRLRVASDYTGNAVPEPCLDLQFGQVEDYSIFISCATSTEDLDLANAFVVYPNPFDQSTNIEYYLKTSSKVSVEVYNLLGDKVSDFASKEVQSAGKHNYHFTTPPSGIYFVKLTIDGKSKVQKIIKM